MHRPTYGLIGRGRVATHLAHYLELEGHNCVRWDRETGVPPEDALAGVDVLLLAIRDDALESFLESHPSYRKGTTVHFSGSTTIDGATGLHPLMTFGPDLYNLSTYRSIPFVEEEGGLTFREIFPALKNPSHVLKPDNKPLYHALCVLGGNFSTLLWSKVFGDFEDHLGLPREILLPYLKQVSINTAAAGRDALTGSLARGDRGTVQRDLQAIAGDPYEALFRAFIDVFDKEEATP